MSNTTIGGAVASNDELGSFSLRTWLNPDGHSSTGSIVVFDGMSSWTNMDGEPQKTMFIEVSDCHGKVRIHQAKSDTREMFTAKVRVMHDVLSEFLAHLDRLSNAAGERLPAKNL